MFKFKNAKKWFQYDKPHFDVTQGRKCFAPNKFICKRKARGGGGSGGGIVGETGEQATKLLSNRLQENLKACFAFLILIF